MPLKSIGFLPDIDGLRALAVLSVVFFHLNIPGFDGGYVGVDIFFVISGFLISGLLHNRIERGTFSFSDFYANRIRRLLPAVLATILVTTLASLWILQPLMLKNFALTAVAAVFSVANILFFSESGYWDTSSDLKPLLHMWSLGVEEQFYLFWPALLVLLARLGSRLYLTGLIALFISSLISCIVYTELGSAATFYLLPFRVWQFCLGALAVEVWRRKDFNLFTQQIFRALGLTLCVFAIMRFNETTAFPGWAALIPSIGAALVLIAASPVETSPWLSNPLATWLGKVSFSMYLVHWPPITLYRSFALEELDTVAKVAIGVLTLVLTVVLHYGVEIRFYQRGHASSGWKGLPSFTLFTGIVLAAISLSIYSFPSQYAQRSVVLDAETIEQYKRERFQLAKKACRIEDLTTGTRCPANLHRPVLIIGNSHEPDAYNVLMAALDFNPNTTLVSFGSINGCKKLHIEGEWVTSSDPNCQKRIAALEASLDSVDWSLIIYSALRPDTVERAPFLRIFETMKARNRETQLVVFSDYIILKEDCANLINQAGWSKACSDPANVKYFAGLPDGKEKLRAELASLTNFHVDKVALLCSDGTLSSCLTATKEGVPMSMDAHHLTYQFAEVIGERLAQQNPSWLSALRSQVPAPEAL